ncbi:PREDICTED: double-stranded RNA-binding protein 2 [Nelumbo nucifera]|uniref:DRBM domain-containing protein n=2 Tax=Nelumbo nucifera TaxID=4432 RepID=A0A822XX29_NELNU|nr:PREDICTED: double-stranded RNA-binding protein 2 [Nelumbo nucifera]DAD26184.1 TPA_asm: hypothetical protein HUJ06_027652 [Nelumbo nucifera]
MYKNQLQELAQRSCFNLPSYTCIREGPDHAPRFKATVNFNGEIFESPNYCTTLRQAEHSAAEIALNSLSSRGPSHSLAARILDETGVYKNLLQEIAQRVGAALPLYTTFRSGLGHLPVFTGTVELAGITFTGEPAKNKKQAEKNAAMAAWLSLKKLAQESFSSSSVSENNDELEQITIARALLNYRLKEKMAMGNSADTPSMFLKKFPLQNPRPSSPQPPPITTSKILPLIRPKSAPRSRPVSIAANDGNPPSSAPQSRLVSIDSIPPTSAPQSRPISTAANDSTPPSPLAPPESHMVRPQKFPAAGAAPYIPFRHFRPPYHGIAPPVTIRTAVPVFSAPPLPPPSATSTRPSSVIGPPIHVAPPVRIRQAVPVFAAPPVRKQAEERPVFMVSPPATRPSPAKVEETASTTRNDLQESEAVEGLKQLKI